MERKTGDNISSKGLSGAAGSRSKARSNVKTVSENGLADGDRV